MCDATGYVYETTTAEHDTCFTSTTMCAFTVDAVELYVLADWEPTSAPTPAPTPAPTTCHAGCGGHPCDELGPHTCRSLEDYYGCDCSGCTCAFDPAPTPAPTLHPTTQQPTPVPTPAPELCTYIVDEGTSDASIGTGWSDTAVTDYPNYGYVHGNCASCDESAGLYGFLESEGISKTFATPAAQPRACLDAALGTRQLGPGAHLRRRGRHDSVHIRIPLVRRRLQHRLDGVGGGDAESPADHYACRSSYYSGSVHGRTRYTCNIDIDIDVAHTASTITVAITSDAEQTCNEESFGVSRFKLEYVDADGAPAGCAPTSVPTPLPSPECPGGESLYKLLLTDGASDGWEGATYRVVDADGTIATSGTLDDGGSGLEYVCLPDGSYELEFTAPAGWGDDADDAAAGGDESCAEVVGPNGGSHSGCVSGSDDEVDTSFTAVGGVVHDDAPTPVPSPAPTLNPSPECPGGESLYKLLLTDGASDGWEGATYRVVDADGTVAASGTLSDGGSDLEYVCLPDGSYELEFTAPAGWGDDADDGSAVGDESCAEVAGSNGGSHSGCVSGSDDEGDTSFTAVGGVVHDDAPTPVPSPAPTLNPSPECPGGESLYKLLLTDGSFDGWEGATYRVVDADGTVAASGTLSDGGSDLEYVCLPDGSYELEFTAPAGWGDDGDDDAAGGDDSCAQIVGSNGGSHSGCVSGSDDEGDTSFTAVGGVVHDDADSRAAVLPTPGPSAAYCTDGRANKAETDIDCGGADCPACAVGGRCLVSGDCESQACVGSVCVEAPTPVPTPMPSLACPSGEFLYKIRLTDSSADGWEGATYRLVDADSGAVGVSGTLSDDSTGTEYVCLPDATYDLEFTPHTTDDAGGADASCAQVMGSNGGSHSGCVSGSSCIDVWTTLVGVNSRSMTLNTSVYAELFTGDELSALRASWAVDETWTMTALGSSTCDEEHRFGFSGGGGFLVLDIPAGATGDALSTTDCVNKQNADFAVRSAAAWEEKLDCELTLSDFTLCKLADDCSDDISADDGSVDTTFTAVGGVVHDNAPTHFRRRPCRRPRRRLRVLVTSRCTRFD